MRDILFDRLHMGLGQVLDLRSQQSAMTAGNIANTDTPNYKAKFIPFDELMEIISDLKIAIEDNNTSKVIRLITKAVPELKSNLDF